MLLKEVLAKANIATSDKPVVLTTDDLKKDLAERSFSWKVSRKATPSQLWAAATAGCTKKIKK